MNGLVVLRRITFTRHYIPNMLHININIYLYDYFHHSGVVCCRFGNLHIQFHDPFDLPTSFSDASVTSGGNTPSPTGAHGLSWLCLQLTTLGICQDVSHFILGLHLLLWSQWFLGQMLVEMLQGCCASYMHQTRNVWYMYLHLLKSFGKYTLPETDIVPENRSLEKGDSYWTIGNHHL